MSTKIVRKPIAFNTDDAHQRKLLEWCEANSRNFSGFVKDVLFVYMSGLSAKPAILSMPQPNPPAAKNVGISDIF